MILAGGRGTRLDVLSAHRAKPAVPFGGKFKLIDFALSNCVNSEIYHVGVLTQYLPMALHNHIGIGKPWDLDRKNGGINLLPPRTGNGRKKCWYQGTAHAVYQNIDYIKNNHPKYVIILPGDHVYKMDYSKMISHHEQKQAELTIAAQRVPHNEANRFGILESNSEMEIVNFTEKPDNPPNNLASMGIYVFNTEILLEVLEKYCSEQNCDFGHHIIPPMIDNYRVFSYEFRGYWKDVGTLKSLWETNLALTGPVPELNLYDKNWKIHTRTEEKPPVKFGEEGSSIQSLVSNGAIINGKVKNSIISPGVFVAKEAVVKNSIIFDDTTIDKNTTISKCIIGENVDIGANCQIGFGEEKPPNEDRPGLLNNGLNVIAKESCIPSNVQVKRNCRIFPQVKEENFSKQTIPTGTTVSNENSPLFMKDKITS